MAVGAYAYMHPLKRYQRASTGWIEEHLDIIEAETALIDEYRERESTEGFRDAYGQQILLRWSELEYEASVYRAPSELSQSHAILVEAISEYALASQVLYDSSDSGQYEEHLDLGIAAMEQFPDTFEQEREAWLGE